MKETNEILAIIYCRVSSQKQVDEGNGLSSQEQQCRRYAEHRGYKIIEAIHDEGVSGKLFERKGIKLLVAKLVELQKQKKKVVVIIDDISRLARSVEVHIAIKQVIYNCGATLESPNFSFKDLPEENLLELISAGMAQYHREVNARQVKDKMKSRMELGHWVLPVPCGYERIISKNKEKKIIKNVTLSKIIEEVFIGIASGRFSNTKEAQKFLANHPEFPKNSKGTVYHQQVGKILKNPLYAGFIHKPDWGLNMTKGLHEAIIAPHIFFKAQEVLRHNGHLPNRKDINQDFVLRGFVICEHCQTPLTASWSHGRRTRYPYYHCRRKECQCYGKAIKREVLEDDFFQILKVLRPKSGILLLAKDVFSQVWHNRLANMKDEKSQMKARLLKINMQRDSIIDKLMSCTKESVTESYEIKLEELNFERMKLESEIEAKDPTQFNFLEAWNKLIDYLGNVDSIWEQGDFFSRRLVLKLVFAKKITYSLKRGFGTALTTLPYKVFQGFANGNDDMVDPSGIEPLTSCMPCKRSPS